MYNFWIYTLCSFLQFPINVSHRNLRPDQHCCQTQSTDFPQCHRPSVTPTVMIIQGRHTRVYISIASFSDIREKKIFWSCSEHYSNLISSQLLDYANLYSPQHKILQVTQSSKISNDISARSCLFMMWYPHRNLGMHNKNRNFSCQCTTAM